MLIWDDLDQDQKIKVFDLGTLPAGRPAKPDHSRLQDGRHLLAATAKNRGVGRCRRSFCRCDQGREESIMNGTHGLRVVTILEEAQRQLDLSLRASAGKSR